MGHKPLKTKKLW